MPPWLERDFYDSSPRRTPLRCWHHCHEFLGGYDVRARHPWNGSERFGECRSTTVYLVVSVGVQLAFWLLPSFIVSAVAVALLGSFLGPLFPPGVVISTNLLPEHLHVSAIAFATAIGGTGGAGSPFAVGAIAQLKAVQVLQPIVLGLIGS